MVIRLTLLLLVLASSGGCLASSEEVESAEVLAAAAGLAQTIHGYDVILDHTDPTSGPSRPLTPAERSAIETEVSGVEWLPGPWDGLGLDQRAVLGLGEPTVDGEGRLVTISLWCGDGCGEHYTLRLIEGDDGWGLLADS